MNNNLPPPLTFDDEFEQYFMSSCKDEILKNTVSTTHEHSPQQGNLEERWSMAWITNHGETSELAESTDSVNPPAVEFALALSQNQLQDGLLNDSFNFPGGEQDVGSPTTEENFAFSPFPFISSCNSSAASSDLILLKNDGIFTKGPTPEAVPTTTTTTGFIGVVESKDTPKINRKRISSESSSSQSFTQDSKNGKETTQKKVKLYEREDKSDPVVKRARYAHYYRTKKKEERKGLQRELAITNEALEKAEGQVGELQGKAAEQASVINWLTAQQKRKEEEYVDLQNSLAAAKEKNSLNPYRTEKLLKGIDSVVKRSSPPGANVQPVQVIRDDKMEEICAVDNLRKQSCTFIFDFDDKTNRLIARKIDEECRQGESIALT